MNVLSLFDGISCGRVALERGGHSVDKYYASEIDKYAITVSRKNWPDIIQLGDIIKWREWDIDWKSISLILAGSPCQGFSFAGKGLNFQDPRSKLFFVFVDILHHIQALNPDVKFLLENVRMKGEHELVITKALDTLPVYINSALVSAQNRPRVYWTNIPGDDMFGTISQPQDKGIMLKDILESVYNGRVSCGAFRGRNPENTSDRTAGIDNAQTLEIREDGKTNTLATVRKDNVCLMVGKAGIRATKQ